MLTEQFDYDLPEALIAQHPLEQRAASRLLVVDRSQRRLEHSQFGRLIEHLRPDDVLVMNDSRVIPARLRGHKSPSGGRIEILLLRQNDTNDWWALLKPGKRVRPGTRISFHDLQERATDLEAEIMEKNEEGHCRLKFSGTENLLNRLDGLGEVPLPPYITRPANADLDTGRYQTVYADSAGSVAAPTAGLHFSNEVLTQIREKGVELCRITLHVGYGTFAPVKAERITDHRMHSEVYEISESSASLINQARQQGRRIVAVGTTSLRTLETVAQKHRGALQAGCGESSIFIYPPFHFQIVNALLTNFHLPRSTLLMLVSAFAAPGAHTGIPFILEAYRAAVQERYRFFSYGDAMFLC